MNDKASRRRSRLGALHALVLAASALGTGACRDIEAIEPAPELGSLGAADRARVELGRRLFFDTGLSGDGTVACASCHLIAEGGDDGRSVSVGVAEQTGRRNAPTVLNASLKEHLFWDGRAGSLEQQALGPLRAENEMGATDEAVLAYLGADPTYVADFDAAFGADGISMTTVVLALAAFERQLVTPSRVDDFLNGDESALDERERRGMDFFRGNCAFCHDGPGVGGRRFEKLGDQVPWPAERTTDLGRFEITGDEDDKLVFAVPQLRNVARTAPYFHDGSVETLEEAVELMARHQLDMELTKDEIDDVVAFLEALSAEPDAGMMTPP